MSDVQGFRRDSNRAKRYIVEIEDLQITGRTIAQSPAALATLKCQAATIHACGETGWLLVFDDNSALLTSDTEDYILPRWNA